MWNIPSLLLSLMVDAVLILPVLAVMKSFLPTPEVDACVAAALQFVSLPANQDTVFLTESLGLLLISCTLWTFVFPYFPVTRFIQRELMNFEKPRPEEQEKLDAVLDYLEERTGISRDSYNYFVLRIPVWNAVSVGAKDIGITSLVLRDFDTEQIAGIIAHEIGHHRNGDIKFQNLCNGAASLCWVCSKILQITCFVLNLLRFIPFLGIVTTFTALIINILILIYNWLIMFPSRIISLFFSRHIEYAADAYAVKIGMGRELASSLHEISMIEKKEHWWQIPFDDHPRTMSRIKTIEKKIAKKEEQEMSKVVVDLAPASATK